MKKMVLVTIGFLSIFIIIMKSDADMKISPSGVTFPDDSTQTTAASGGGVTAPLHLSGSFTTGGYTDAPAGAVISGVNSYSGSYRTYGGYFQSAGSSGSGVYGYATNTGAVTNYGGYFKAAGSSGRGVYGYAPGTNGKGVIGFATGSSGRAVEGYAGNSGNVTNYGGYFRAAGSYGRGVYGYAEYSGNVINYGGYFKAASTSGRGVHGYATGSSGRGVTGYGTGTNGTGVYGSGGRYDFYAGGPGINYASFTGAHEVKFTEDMPEEIVPGLIVSVTGKTETRKDQNGEISISSTLPTVTLSTRARDKAVFGVIVSDGPLPEDHWYEAQEGEQFGVVNALGEGRVWVTDINGQVQAGDYITTSFVQGYGQLQDDDLLHSYTLGKAIETIDWDQVTETVQHNGKMYKRYLIAVVYTSG